MNSKFHILVVDDDPEVLDTFSVILEGIENCTLFTAVNYRQAEKIVLGQEIHLAIIDIVLPDTDGYTICRDLRVHPGAAEAYFILMSSDKHHLKDRIRAYNVGAQEFLAKPFDMKEVELIINSKIRFFRSLKNKPKSEQEHFLSSGKFLLNERYKTLNIGDNKVDLSDNEYNLLKYFISNPERIIPVEELVNVWENPTTPDNVRVYISKLRSKIEEDSQKPLHLVNAKKTAGYIFYPVTDSF